MTQPDESLTSTFLASAGRDSGKSFKVFEIDPMTKAGYVLRFNSALRIASFQELLDTWRSLNGEEEDDGAAIDFVMRTLQGSDPQVVHGLLQELLDFVHVAPDPQHPGAFRPLMKTDIREMKTLGDALLALVKLNFISEV